MKNSPGLSLVVPFFNEAGTIGDTVEKLKSFLEGNFEDWELVLVNDGGTDGSESAAREAMGEEPKIRLVTYERNRGRGHALRMGIGASEKEFIATTEADLTWGTDVVARMYSEMSKEDADIVIASPHLAPGGLEVPWHRKVLSRNANRLISLLLGGRVTMATGMTRCYRADAARTLETRCDGKEFHLEILILALARGLRVRELPAKLSWAGAGGSRGGAGKTMKLIRSCVEHLRLLFRMRKEILTARRIRA